MGKKIFISYKYADSQVRDLNIYEDARDLWGNSFRRKVTTTARHYVDILQSKIDASDHINKGEDDGEDLGSLADSTIGSKLGDKIFDSTVTIVLISKGMKDNTSENDQWIPWEISYSLREQSRNGQRSKTNAILAVVLPDENGNYDYFITHNHQCNSRTLNTPFLFKILRENMFNISSPDTRDCNGNVIYHGYSSYIHSIKWDDFISNIDGGINIALAIWQKRGEYVIVKSV
jgi:hypothetical protein